MTFSDHAHQMTSAHARAHAGADAAERDLTFKAGQPANAMPAHGELQLPSDGSGEDVAPSIDASSGPSGAEFQPCGRGGGGNAGDEVVNAGNGSGVGAGGGGGTRASAIAEAWRYRKRAQAAEKILEDLKNDLAERDQKLSEKEQTIAALERRQVMDELLLEAEVIDLEAARLLTEMAVAQMDAPDVEFAVNELRQRRPYLFRQSPRKVTASTGVLSAHGHENGSLASEALDDAAAEASVTGSRSDLLRYLRLRRSRRQ